MSSTTDNSSGVRVSLFWLARYVRRHTGTLACVIALAALCSLLAVAQPYISKLIIDEGLIGRRIDLLVRLCCAMVGLAVIGFALGALNRWLYVRVSGRILFAMREEVYAHLLELPPEFFRKRSVGDLVTRLDGDVAEVQRFSTDTLLAFVNGVLMLVAAAVIMVTLSPALTLIAAGSVPLQLCVRHWARRSVSESTRAVREQTSRVAGFFVETLGAAKVVQGAAAEDWEQQRLGSLNETLLTRLVRQQLVGYSVGGASGLLSHATTAAVFIAGGLGVVHGSLTVGTLVAFIAYLTRGTGSAASLMNLYTAYQRAAVSLRRVRELLDAQPLDRRRGTGRSLEACAPGHVRFEAIHFTPAEREEPLFTDLSLDIPAGAKLVLCGDSGVGKSTLIDLLRGFVVPGKGRVLIDGVELGEYELGSLRRHIAVIEAEPALFRGSIADNLRYGHFDAPQELILDAARRAGVEQFVAHRPEGYEAELGAGGAGLSTGQRQRLAIARALAGNPVIVVLDEATSNLDTLAARSMHELIDRHFGQRTRIVITHAPQKVPRADRVLELRNGSLTVSAAQVVHG
ncbi:MAG TPA: ABC transporter ATP-binding protein [Steroidobacteraceae bacterium]|nr:ABC transporter ATP-binding protein [Steroidobacteraceae bacterium]